jgi:hypothetical protein
MGWLDLYKIKLLAGRDYAYTDFDPDFGKLHNIILNESATKLLGFTTRGSDWKNDPPRDQEMGGHWGDQRLSSKIIALSHVEPTMLFPAYSSNGSDISIKVSAGNLPATITPL